MGQTFTDGGVIYDILRSLKQQRSVKKQNKRKYSALALNLRHAMYLRFVVCFFVEVVVVVVWLYLFCFLLTATCFLFVVSFLVCLYFVVVVVIFVCCCFSSAVCQFPTYKVFPLRSPKCSG